MAPPMCTTPSWWTARRDAGGVPVAIIGNYWRVLKSREMPSNLTKQKTYTGLLRRRPELNRGTGICSPLPNHSATPPLQQESRTGIRFRRSRADDGIRTRDPDLGKVVLYH